MVQFNKFVLLWVTLVVCALAYNVVALDASLTTTAETQPLEDAFLQVKKFIDAPHIIPTAVTERDIGKSGLSSFTRRSTLLLDIQLEADAVIAEVASKMPDNPTKWMPELVRRIILSRNLFDPYAMFCVFNSLENIKVPRPQDATRNAFMLMARVIMNAPFQEQMPLMQRAPIDNETINGSFAYFRIMALEFKGAILKADASGPLFENAWQMYFNEEALFAHVTPWINALYYFYWKEAQFFATLSDPFAMPGFMDELEAKLSSERFYDLDFVTAKDEEFQRLQKVSSKKHSKPIWSDVEDYDFYEWLGAYLIRDIDVYWSLIKFLKGKDKKTVEKFWNLMISNRANPNALVDAQGNTPYILAQEYSSDLQEIMRETLEHSGQFKRKRAKKPKLEKKRMPLKDLTNTNEPQRSARPPRKKMAHEANLGAPTMATLTSDKSHLLTDETLSP